MIDMRKYLDVDNLEEKVIELMKKGKTIKDIIRYIQISTVIDVYISEISWTNENIS